MFKRLSGCVTGDVSGYVTGAGEVAPHGDITLTLDGQPIACRAGDTVAAALLAANVASCRSTPVTGTARGPYCMMGVCYDCLVEIDGAPNQQACMTPARDGMVVARQPGAREVL